MTFPTIVDALEAVVQVLANDLKVPPPATGLTEAEWAYVKGIASGEVMRLRDRLIQTARPENR